jgi:uncharacterized SAM-binding protein YcdF (DUF218 family)
MFFVLSKVLGFLVVPSNVILGIGIVGIVLLLTRFRRAGVRMMVVSLLLLLVIGITPIGMALIAALESRFPPGKEGGPPVTGIIVLGGPIDNRMSTARGMLSVSGEVERLLEGANLAKRHSAARLVFTGGNPSLFRDDPPEAVYAVQLFEQLGDAHAALGRRLPQGRVSGRGLSGRLAHAARSGPVPAFAQSPRRHRRAQLGGA